MGRHSLVGVILALVLASVLAAATPLSDTGKENESAASPDCAVTGLKVPFDIQKGFMFYHTIL